MLDELLEAWRIKHRGNILLTLKTSGHPLDRKAACAIWGWDRM